jgi:hypothetical protein
VTVAEIDFAGQYVTSNFHVTSGIGGTVKITDPAVPNGGSVELEYARTLPRRCIDLRDIAFEAQTTLAYSENAAATGGTLTVSDGRHTATIALLGNYMAGSFVTTADGHGGLLSGRTAEVSIFGLPFSSTRILPFAACWYFGRTIEHLVPMADIQYESAFATAGSTYFLVRTWPVTRQRW